MTTEKQVCKQHVITQKTQQDDGGSVVRLPTKMDPKQLGTSRLAAERILHIFEGRLEQKLKDHKEVQVTRSQLSSELPRRDETCYCVPIVQSSRK